jgi:hypothetical protein
MPQERPRHEPLKLEGHRIHEESYRESEGRLKGKSIYNADPPKRGNPKPRPSADVIAALQERLRSSNNALKSMVQGFLADPAADTVREELRRRRGDLAGTFNDTKLALAATLPRDGNASPQEVERRKVLDWLQYAEDKGKLADCLDQWNDARRNQDWERMAQLSDAIRDGITYDKTIVEDWFGKLDSSLAKDERVVEQRDRLRSLLDGIAFEVSQEAERAMFGPLSPTELGGRMVAAQEALDRACNRRLRAHEIAASVAALQDSSPVDLSLGDAASYEVLPLAKSNVEKWEQAARDMSKVADAIANGKDPSPRRQLDAAKLLGDVDALHNAILYVLDQQPTANPTSGRMTVWTKDDLLFTLREVANNIVLKHDTLASQLTDPAAKGELKQGKGIQALKDAIKQVDDDRKKVGTLYEQAYAASANGKLRIYWGKNRDLLYDHLEGLSKSADGAVATWAWTAGGELKRLFVEDLGPTLEKWSERQPADIYGLSWQLIDTLRAYKAGMERVFGQPPMGYQYVAHYGRQVLDAAMAAVAGDLADDVAAGRV